MPLLPHRKKQTKRPTTLPKEFLKTVSTLFQKQFSKERSGSTFLAYGDLYSDEAVLAISLSHPKSVLSASFHISYELPGDVAENPSKVTERLKVMVDVAASWFSQCFQAGKGLEAVHTEMKGSDPAWQEFEWEGHQLFVKLNRTNYTLETAAAEFLKKKGFSEDGDDPLDELGEFDEEDDESLN